MSRAAAGAERTANSELAAPACAARQQQARNVRACDQQDKADSAQQHEQGSSHVADQRLLQRPQQRTGVT